MIAFHEIVSILACKLVSHRSTCGIKDKEVALFREAQSIIGYGTYKNMYLSYSRPAGRNHSYCG